MREQDSKIKTLFNFEETDDEFTEALLDFDVSDPEYDTVHGMLKFDVWTQEQFDEFSDLLWYTAVTLRSTILEKNTKYNNAYWWVRQACKEKYGDPTIPYFVHSVEKTLRCESEYDNEDSELDLLGYHFLEYVCRKLEKKWETNKRDNDNEPEFKCGQTVLSEEFIEEIPVRKHKPNTCYKCGGELTGRQKKFCSTDCFNDFYKKARRLAIEDIETGVSHVE